MAISEKEKKRSSQIFLEVSGVFQQNFYDLKNKAVLGREQANWGFEANAKNLTFEAKAKNFKMSSRPRTSLKTPPLFKEAVKANLILTYK